MVEDEFRNMGIMTDCKDMLNALEIIKQTAGNGKIRKNIYNHITETIGRSYSTTLVGLRNRSDGDPNIKIYRKLTSELIQGFEHFFKKDYDDSLDTKNIDKAMSSLKTIIVGLNEISK